MPSSASLITLKAIVIISSLTIWGTTFHPLLTFVSTTFYENMESKLIYRFHILLQLTFFHLRIYISQVGLRFTFFHLSIYSTQIGLRLTFLIIVDIKYLLLLYSLYGILFIKSILLGKFFELK